MPLWYRRGREDEKDSGIVWQVKSFEIVTLFHENKRQISRVRLKLSLVLVFKETSEEGTKHYGKL